MTRRSYPPAWYRDPRVEGQLRRWNGQRWTAATRPYPSWLSQVPVATGPRRRSPSFFLWLGSAACLGAAVFTLISPAPPVPDGRITDRAFVSGGEALCATVVDHFAATDADYATRAARTAARADAWAEMLASMRALPVADEDRAPRAAWLDAWDLWIVEGHAYADALADGDTDGAEQASARSEPAKRLIDTMAVASNMPSCQFRI